jgi:hypothetical protein
MSFFQGQSVIHSDTGIEGEITGVDSEGVRVRFDSPIRLNKIGTSQNQWWMNFDKANQELSSNFTASHSGFMGELRTI